MKIRFTILVVLLLATIYNIAYAGDEDLPDCMTESGAFEIQQMHRDAIVQRKGLFAVMGYSQALNGCESKGSIYAKYINAEDELILAKILQSQANTNKYLGDPEKQLAKKEAFKATNKAISKLRDLADSGYPLAAYSLGELYYEGTLVDQNKITAGINFVRAGFLAYDDNRKNLLNKCFEKAKETVPDHPELPKLKALVYQ